MAGSELLLISDLFMKTLFMSVGREMHLLLFFHAKLIVSPSNLGR